MKSSKPDTRGYVGGGTPATGLGPMRQTPAGKTGGAASGAMKGAPRQVGGGKPFPGVGKPSVASRAKTAMGGKAMARTVKG